MQFQIAALTLALAVGASAASVDRMTKVVKKADAKVTVETFNFSTCNPEASAATFELNEVGDCVTFEQGYGSASYTATEDAGPVLRKFSIYLYLSLALAFFPPVSRSCGDCDCTRDVCGTPRNSNGCSWLT